MNGLKKYLLDIVIFTCLLTIGIVGLIVICFIPMPHIIGATIGIVSSILIIAGGSGIWAVFDAASHNDDDDDNGPHFYGPGGTII